MLFRSMCNGISRYYVRVAHLFAAINLACNPHLQYVDLTGNKQTVPVMLKNTIPKGVKTTLTKLNFCTKRITALKPVQNTDNRIVVRGKNCNMNKKTVPIMGGSNEEYEEPVPVQEVYHDTKSFNDEIGIPELERLYYDLFNFKFETFNNMSQSAQVDYNNDLLDFYNVFTGSSLTQSVLVSAPHARASRFFHQSSSTVSGQPGDSHLLCPRRSYPQS